MEKKDIIIGNKEYTVELAVTPEKQKEGLQIEIFQLRTLECYLYMINHRLKWNIG